MSEIAKCRECERAPVVLSTGAGTKSFSKCPSHACWIGPSCNTPELANAAWNKGMGPASIQTVIDVMAKHNSELESKIAKLKAELPDNATCDINTRLSKENGQLRTMNGKLEDQATHIQQLLDKSRANFGVEQDKVGGLNSKITDLQTELAMELDYRRSAGREITKLEKESSEWHEGSIILSDEVDKLRTDNTRLRERGYEYSSEIVALNTKNTELQSRLDAKVEDDAAKPERTYHVGQRLMFDDDTECMIIGMRLIDRDGNWYGIISLATGQDFALEFIQVTDPHKITAEEFGRMTHEADLYTPID